MQQTHVVENVPDTALDYDIFTRVLAPVSVENFIENYFQKKPLYIPGPDDKFDFLFQTDDFKENLDKIDHIRAVFPLLRQAHIGISDISDMLKAGSSICVTGMEKAHEALGLASDSISKRLNYCGKVSFRSYLSPQGSGFDMHFDARAATVLQIGGRKRWWYKIDKKTLYPKSNSPHTEYLRDSGFNPPELDEMESIVLSPGDFLCLPAGAWHCAKAEEDSLSLNMAFDHKNASYGDSLLLYLKDYIDNDARRRAPAFSLMPQPWNDKLVINEITESIDDLINELKKLKKNPTELQSHLQSWFEAKN